MSLLNQAKAEAVYGAMCALNNVGGKLLANFEHEDKLTTVHELPSGLIVVCDGRTFEEYDGQTAFAAAYDLQ